MDMASIHPFSWASKNLAGMIEVVVAVDKSGSGRDNTF
jgi:hypothetical protein